MRRRQGVPRPLERSNEVSPVGMAASSTLAFPLSLTDVRGSNHAVRLLVLLILIVIIER